MTFAIIRVGAELKAQVDVRAVTSSFDISYIFAVIVEFVHVLDVGTTDYKIYITSFVQKKPPFGTDEIPWQPG